MVSIQAAIKNNDWATTFGKLDTVDPAGDPVRLFGAASIYSILSDYTYNSVNYNLEGFMYQNADNRNDEYDKNKYNAMHLLSKSKEYLFDALYVINSQGKNVDQRALFLQFMANMKLNRFVQAYKLLNGLGNSKQENLMLQYAYMAYNVETNAEGAEQTIERLVQRGELNALYYLARHLLNNGSPAAASMILHALLGRTEMPFAARLLTKTQDVLEKTKL